MSKRRRGLPRLAPSSSSLTGTFAFAQLGDDLLGEIRKFADAPNAQALQERLAADIVLEVDAILTAIQDFDAFDVVELLRLREIPVAPVAGLLDAHDGNGAVIDLISLVMLTRGHRMPSGKKREETEPHHVIPELHDRASRLLRLAMFMQTAQSQFRPEDRLARLAFEYQSYLVSVRSLQYESVQTAHDRAIFDRPEIDRLLLAKLRFTYRDFMTVREAIQERYSRILTGLRDDVGDIFQKTTAEDREPSAAEAATVRESMLAFIFLPAQRASFTAEDIAAETGIESARVEAVLEAFSIGFDGTQEAAEVVKAFLRGVNPIARTSLLRDADGNYAMTALQIGTDTFRLVAESVLKPDSRAWQRYDRTRARVTETLAVQGLERVLQNPAAYTNLKYIAPKTGVDVAALGPECPDPRAVGEQTECDALFLIEDVGVCLEVKGRTIAEPARRGDLVRLRREIESTFGGGARQARRLEDLIKSNGGVWLEDDTWLDLRALQEIRSVVIGLDFFGPLAVALGDLQNAGALEAGSVPWIASLHDLEIISKVVDRPAEFLLYIRRRTDSGVATHYRGADELDLFMLFLDGGLYVEPDPDETQRQHPTAGPGRTRDRRQHERDALPTFVGNHTDWLDAWMYRMEGTSPFEIDKPTFTTNRSVQELVDFLADGRKPGWFRFSADLLGLAGRAQKQLGDQLQDLVSKTRGDNRGHSLFLGLAGMWGYPAFFVGTEARGDSRGEAAEKLRTYMEAKKHQIGSDRSLGLLLDETGAIVQVIYMNNPVGEDHELDQLGSAIGLRPPDERIRPVPPSARRETRRLRGPRPAKKRRR